MLDENMTASLKLIVLSSAFMSISEGEKFALLN